MVLSVGGVPNGRRMNLPVVRVRAGSLLRVVLLGAGPVWIETHWSDRALICPGDECPACPVQNPRCVGYLAVAIAAPGMALRPAMLEVTPSCWGRFAGLLEMEGLRDERGVVVELSRRTAKSPLVAVPLLDAWSGDLPAFTVAGLFEALAVLYRLPVPTPGEKPEAWAVRVQSSARLQLVEALRSM